MKKRRRIQKLKRKLAKSRWSAAWRGGELDRLKKAVASHCAVKPEHYVSHQLASMLCDKVETLEAELAEATIANEAGGDRVITELQAELAEAKRPPDDIVISAGQGDGKYQVSFYRRAESFTLKESKEHTGTEPEVRTTKPTTDVEPRETEEPEEVAKGDCGWGHGSGRLIEEVCPACTALAVCPAGFAHNERRKQAGA